MRLALALGRTIDELRDSILADELALWAELYRKSPWGGDAEDERNAVVCAVVNNSLGGTGTVRDFRVQWDGGDRAEKRLIVSFAAGMKAMAAQVNKDG